MVWGYFVVCGGVRILFYIFILFFVDVCYGKFFGFCLRYLFFYVCVVEGSCWSLGVLGRVVGFLEFCDGVFYLFVGLSFIFFFMVGGLLSEGIIVCI